MYILNKSGIVKYIKKTLLNAGMTRVIGMVLLNLYRVSTASS